jgi:hypothetical protein
LSLQDLAGGLFWENKRSFGFHGAINPQVGCHGSRIIFKKSFVGFLEEGGVTPLGGGKKRVKMKEWRGINEKK